jgi:hypothetical protein
MRIFLFVNVTFICLLITPVFTIASTGEKINASDTIKVWDPVFGNDFKKSLYRTTLDISKNHLTGFIFIKKVSDTSFRIIFSNDFGMQIFDFEFSAKEFIVQYCFPSLDRKSLLKLLDNDFRILLFSNTGIKKITPKESDYGEDLTYKIRSKTGKWIYRTHGATQKIISLRSAGRFFSKTRIDLHHSDESVTGITISNPTIKLRIEMKHISP